MLTDPTRLGKPALTRGELDSRAWTEKQINKMIEADFHLLSIYPPFLSALPAF
jgi:hypothetical protein